jgi:hypothetical protein
MAGCVLDSFALIAYLRGRISLANAFASALAKHRKCELVTGDPEFKTLERELKIAWLKS